MTRRPRVPCPRCGHPIPARYVGGGGGLCPSCGAHLLTSAPPAAGAISGTAVFVPDDAGGWRRLPTVRLTDPPKEAPR